MMYFNLNKKEILIKYFIVLSWFSCWFSISFNPEIFFHSKDFNFFQMLNYLRGISPVVILPLLFLILLILLIKKKIEIRKNFIFFGFFVFFLIQIIGLFKTDNSIINIYYLICSFNVIIICFVFKEIFTEKELILILNATFFFLICLLIYFGTTYILTYLGSLHSSFYGVWSNLETDQLISRPTGFSRIALIILIISTFMPIKKNELRIINYILLSTCSFFIIVLGSRTILAVFILFIISYILIGKLFNFKKIINLILKFFLIPIILIFGLELSHDKIYNHLINNDIIEKKVSKTIGIFRQYPGNSNLYYSKKLNLADVYTSGRYSDWVNILKKNHNYIYGFGVMGDRYLINTTASNIIFYSYASAGALGVILITLISLFILYSSILTLKNSNNLYLQKYKLISFFCIISLMLRSIFETSYGVFGIDLMLLSFFVSIIERSRNK